MWASTWMAVKYCWATQQGRVLPLLPTGQETFAKSAQLSAPDWDMRIHSFHKYLLSSHYVPGPGISFLPLPVVLRRNTDSDASGAQVGDRNGGRGTLECPCLVGRGRQLPYPSWLLPSGNVPSRARASVPFRESTNRYFYAKSYHF